MIADMAKKFLASPEGQKVIIEFLMSEEGKKTIANIMNDPKGKEMAVSVIKQIVSGFDLPEDKKTLIQSALNALL